LSGGCEQYLDWNTQGLLEADAGALIRHVRLGEMLPEVGFVGNTVVMKQDAEGRALDERLRRVKTASFIAAHTRKPGSMEVWDPKEIDYLVELGIIARGSEEAYRDNPCFVTAKETISPLFLDKGAGDILLEFARRELPCTVIPMPISGLSAPVTPLGNAVIGNAEFLGVLTALQAVCPDAPVGGGTISGVLDMKSGNVSFSAPEAILQDIAVAEVHEQLYGFNYLIGTGYTDARYPNPQLLAEKTMKFLFSYLTGRYSYPVGLLGGGSIFSEEQALVDLELCRYIHGHFREAAPAGSLEDTVALIHETGIRGSFLSGQDTLDHFRENWLWEVFDTGGFLSIDENRKQGLYSRAHEKIQELFAGGDFWEIDTAGRREIEKVVRHAEQVLCE
jgi:trimethylamine--corrinoid protein Co-methyltransferase